jgi:ABC-type sugar transport system ATPase subunit
LAPVAATGPRGREVVAGIRPEQVGRAPRSSQSVAVQLLVSFVEVLGEQMNVHARTASGAAIVARARAADDVRPGATAGFFIEPAAIHLFEPGEFGRNLLFG